jgi:hypothetical protein
MEAETGGRASRSRSRVIGRRFIAWRVEAVAFVVAVACLTTALLGADAGDRRNWTRRYWREDSRLDATLYTARLEMWDGRPRIRPGSVTRKPTMGAHLWEVEHVSDERVLFPDPMRVGVLGAPRRTSDLALWYTSGEYRIAGRTLGVGRGPGPRPPLGVHWWDRSGHSRGVGTPFLDTEMRWEFLDRGSQDYIDLGSLPIGLLSLDDAWEAESTDAWRAAVRAGLATASAHEFEPYGSYESVAGLAALAVLLDVRAASDPLLAMQPAVKRRTYWTEELLALRGALFALRPESAPDGDAALVYLLNQFPNPRGVAKWIADDDERPAVVRDVARDLRPDARPPLPRYPRSEWWMSVGMLLAGAVPFVLALVRRRPSSTVRVRPRDAAALAALLAYACIPVPLFGPLTTQTPALLCFAILLALVVGEARWRRLEWAPVALAAAAIAGPFAAHVASPLVDALARLVVFGTLARIACGELDRPRRGDGLPPARPARAGAATVAEILVVTLAIGAWVAHLAFGGFTLALPDAPTATLTAGVLSATMLGFLLSGRRPGRGRPALRPSLAMAIAVGLTLHGTMIAAALLSPHQSESVGDLDLAAEIAAGIVLVFVLAEILRATRARNDAGSMAPTGTV